MRRIATPLAAVLCLLPAAPAEGKGIAAIEVCGATECREAEDREGLAGVAFGGAPSDPPPRPAGWYRVRVAVHGDLGRERFTTVVVPSSNRMRGADGVWLMVGNSDMDAFRQLVRGLEPKPAAALGDLEAPPRVRVDEALAPPAQPASSSGPAWPWVAAGAFGLLVLTAAAMALRRRRRLPPTAPAEG